MARRNEASGIVLGAFGLLGINCIVIYLLLSLVGLSNQGGFYNPIISALAGIGLFQLLYVIPAVIWLKQRQRWGLMKGVIIGAVLTALLNGGCWLLMFSLSSV